MTQLKAKWNVSQDSTHSEPDVHLPQVTTPSTDDQSTDSSPEVPSGEVEIEESSPTSPHYPRRDHHPPDRFESYP